MLAHKDTCRYVHKSAPYSQGPTAGPGVPGVGVTPIGGVAPGCGALALPLSLAVRMAASIVMSFEQQHLS